MSKQNARISDANPWHKTEFIFAALIVIAVLVMFSFYFDASIFGEFRFISQQATQIEQPPASLIQPQTESEISYIYANGQRIASVSGSNVKFYHADYLGSTRVTTDLSGNKISSSDNYPFGSVLREEGSVNKYKFTGKELDSTGLQYFGARYYDSTIGRFTQIDPIKDNHPYSYANNNPMKFVDPTGEEITSVSDLYLWPVRKLAYRIASNSEQNMGVKDIIRAIFKNKNTLVSGYHATLKNTGFNPMVDFSPISYEESQKKPDILAMYLGLEKITLPEQTLRPQSLKKYGDVKFYSIAAFTVVQEKNIHDYIIPDLLNMKIGDVIGSHAQLGFPYMQSSSPVYTDINLASYTLSYGRDEKGIYISVFDIYDFDPEQYNKNYNIEGWQKIQPYLMKFIGKQPIGFYDRFYLDENQIRAELERRSGE
jgi:RHS repeat-associated protein